MRKRSIFAILALTLVWIILMDEVSWQNVAIGLMVGMVSLRVNTIYISIKEIKNVNFIKLAWFFIWLFGRMIAGTFSLIKQILLGAKWGIVKERIEINNEFLCSVLALSITLIPGTVYLRFDGAEISFLGMENKKTPGFPTAVNDLRSIERKLLKMQTNIKDE